jgi:signal transduction histidine kinase/ligand-binding sensor domain-containing protein
MFVPQLMRQLTCIAFSALFVPGTHLLRLVAADLPGAQSDYLIDVWQSDDGLPQNSVISMAQTTDGYLWLSTFGGLARFDGKRFDVFNGDLVPELAGEIFTTIRADAAGNLWLRGEHNRVVVGHNGHFRKLGEVEGLPAAGATVLEAGPDGMIWVGDSRGRLLKYEGGRFIVAQATPPTLDWGPLTSLILDAEGGFWTLAGGGCARLAGGKWSLLIPGKSMGDLGPMRALSDGSVVLVVGPPDRLLRYWEGHFSDLGTIPGSFHWYFVAEDPTGDLWLPSGGGALRRDRDGRWTELTRSGGLPADGVRSELLDREGNRWFGTDGGGLVRLKRRAMRGVGVAEGMSKQIALSVAADGTNGIWVAVLRGGLNHFDGTHFSQVLLSPWFGTESLAWCVWPSRDGGVWIGTYTDGLLHLDAGGKTAQHFDSTASPGMIDGPIVTLLETRGGELWLGGERGLSHYSKGQFQSWTTTNGLVDDSIRALEEDTSEGVWIGTSFGLNYIQNGAIKKFTEADGLAGNAIHCLFRDSHGDLWIAGGGLTRFRDGRFTVLDVHSSPLARAITSIIEDDLGYLWFATTRGILRASRRQLNEVCGTPGREVEFSLFTKADGLPSNDCSGFQPAAWKGADGRLWFTSLNGVATIDPKNLHENQLPPPVVIEDVLADGQPLPWQLDQRETGVRVPAGTSRLEIRFAALSYSAPEKNRYRCWLERFDSDWSRPGTGQTAAFTRPPPGDYHFHVRGCNNDGIWNETGATIAVAVLPFYWQTKWFHVLVAAVLCATVFWLVRARLAQVERRRRVQEAFARQLIQTQEAERQRIARELHDGIGQSLLLVKNRLSQGIKQTQDTSPVSQQLQQASAEVSQAIEEVRSTARALRPVELDRLGLGKALESMLERSGASTHIKFSHELDEIGGLPEREAEIQLYRIAQEAVNNALKHSKAREVIVELKREAANLRLTVQDDGTGFEPGAADRSAGSGLSGMSERARLIGAAFSVQAAPGKGCRLTVTMPLPTQRDE